MSPGITAHISFAGLRFFFCIQSAHQASNQSNAVMLSIITTQPGQLVAVPVVRFAKVQQESEDSAWRAQCNKSLLQHQHHYADLQVGHRDRARRSSACGRPVHCWNGAFFAPFWWRTKAKKKSENVTVWAEAEIDAAHKESKSDKRQKDTRERYRETMFFHGRVHWTGIRAHSNGFDRKVQGLFKTIGNIKRTHQPFCKTMS